MVTTRIRIKQHLAEYMVGKYGNHDWDSPLRFPDKTDLYHTIYDLLERRPKNVSGVDTGNLYFCLPERFPGKNTGSFNYLGIRSIDIIERKIEVKFWAEIHDMLDEEKTFNGKQYKKTVIDFMEMYRVEAISEDAILKNYQRWRDKIRPRDKKRDYVRK